MKFLVVTYGTEGDARPLAVLCRALMDAGHEAHLLADRATLGAAAALGVPATALAGDIRGTLEPHGAISRVIEGKSLSEMTKALANIANSQAENWLRAIIELGQGADAIIVSALAAFVGLSAAEYLRIKAIGLSMIPITPTAAFPHPFIPTTKLPGFLNRASHHLVNGVLWRAFRKATNEARAKVCQLPARKENWTQHPILYGVSPSLLPRPADWPSFAQVCGQLIRPTRDWMPPEALRAFLLAGEPPIYVGFGSMTGFDRQQLRDAIVGGIAGRRALFYPGWSGIDPSSLPGNFFVLGDTPHDWLFPRTSLVIHHGGSGTTHSAARAGVPSVVVPFAGDQPFWAERLYRAGVAARLPNAKSANATTLGRAITLAQRDEVISRARALGERMRSEDGPATAVAFIEQIMASG